jgi:hypothetical protein
MATCHICEKALPGRPNSPNATCGSCVLERKLEVKTPKGGDPRNGFAVLEEMTKAKVPYLERTKPKMNELRLKSNQFKSQAVLIGNHGVVFNERGEARCPIQAQTALELFMMHQPGRITIVEQEVLLFDEVAPEVVVPEPVKVEEPVLEEEVRLEGVDDSPEEIVIEDSSPLEDQVEAQAKKPKSKKK